MNNKNLSKRAIGYWAATALLGLEMAVGGVLDLMRSDAVFGAMTTLTHLGYPVYFANILGAWKLLGAIAILAPGFPRLKEWAYAGITFNMTGAIVSHIWSGDGAAAILPPLVFLAVAAASWTLRPKSRRLLDPREAEGLIEANADTQTRAQYE